MCYWDVDYWFGWVWGPQKKYVSGNGKHNLSLFCVWMEGGSTAVSCFPVWPGWRAKTIPDPRLLWSGLRFRIGLGISLSGCLLLCCRRVSVYLSVRVSEYLSILRFQQVGLLEFTSSLFLQTDAWQVSVAIDVVPSVIVSAAPTVGNG